MRQNLVIKIVVVFLLFSCISAKTQIINENKAIIDKELERNLESINSKAYLEFSLNDYLINFLNNENLLDNINIKNDLSEYEIQSLFNRLEIKNLKTSLEINSKSKYELPNNKKILMTLSGLNEIQSYDIDRINLSYAAITQDKMFSLIAFAKGKKDRMEGGINLYQKKDEKWVYKSTIDIWIE